MVRYTPHKEVADVAEDEHPPGEAAFPYSTCALHGRLQ